MGTDSLADGARGCRRMHEPGKMSARFRLADAAGMASAKPVRSSGVFIRMSRHLSSCIHTTLCMLRNLQRCLLQKSGTPFAQNTWTLGNAGATAILHKLLFSHMSGEITVCWKAGCLAITWLMQGCPKSHIVDTCTVLTGYCRIMMTCNGTACCATGASN